MSQDELDHFLFAKKEEKTGQNCHRPRRDQKMKKLLQKIIL